MFAMLRLYGTLTGRSWDRFATTRSVYIVFLRMLYMYTQFGGQRRREQDVCGTVINSEHAPTEHRPAFYPRIHTLAPNLLTAQA